MLADKLAHAHSTAAKACGRISGMLARRKISKQALAVAAVELEQAADMITDALKEIRHGHESLDSAAG